MPESDPPPIAPNRSRGRPRVHMVGPGRPRVHMVGPGRPRVHIVGLGPGDVDLVTTGTHRLLEQVPVHILRTRRHPAASLLGDAESCDDLYESLDTFDEVYTAVVGRVVERATAHGAVVYAVPGSPRVAERTVVMLDADDRVEVDIVPALSFIDVTWTQLGVDPLTDGVRIVDGRRFAVDAAGERGPLLVAQCDQPQVLSDIKLSIDDPGEVTVTVLQRMGLPDEAVFEVPWAALDREVEPDHLTSLWIPSLPSTVGAEFVRFDEMVKRLRLECPWDAEQTHESLRRYLLEETYEVLEAIDGLDAESGDGYADLEEELGDLLYQILFHSVLATEAGWFTAADVARTVHDKLYARHPHVYGEVQADDAETVLENWEAIKKAEKGRESVMDGIPGALPALLYAFKVQKKAAGQRFGFTSLDGALGDVADELAEVTDDPVPGEVGDLLFAAVQVARQLDVDPETALRDAAQRFADRFRYLERHAASAGVEVRDLTDADHRRLWSEAKAGE